MFTVRFFDVLTGAHAVSHPVEHSRAHANKTSSVGFGSWFKRR